MAAHISDAVIYDATLTVMAERGYRGATTRSIADAAGVNEVTLFRRYGDKRGLVLAAIHNDLAAYTAKVHEPSGDVAADLTVAVEYYGHVYRHRNGLVGTLILEAARDAEVADILREPLSAIARLGELLAHYQAAGQLVEEHPMLSAQSLVAPLLMITIVGRIAGATAVEVSPADVVRRFLFGRTTPPLA